MIGIRDIAVHLPDTTVDNLVSGARFGEEPSFVTDKIGARQLRVLSDNEDTSDLVVAAVERLLADSALVRANIDALVVVTQNPDGFGLPHTAALAHERLELSQAVAAFDVSLGCSGYVYGLSIVRGLMEQAGLTNGILVTADPYSKIVDPKDRNTALLFGDAATATWLSKDGLWKYGTPILATDGAGWSNLHVDEGRHLVMNGRQVFNFAATRVPKQINELLQQRGITPDDVDLFCLHQGSAAILDAISRRFGDLNNRFIKDMELTGNTVSSSIPILLRKHVLGSNIERVVVSGFGVGLSWATNLIERHSYD
ncbi:ketoacyl-ACP synthase III [Congregibacter brevis]|uniref:Ketoacyl-ACP synthase III n=1 Tax=Congregibacter brevis TaxID=3081201 RepID=A0ABZ0IF32_9GAMM|nr:ketoacyl-ACP synthase III [Congregibacter sp. IMCC45268]